MPNDNFIQLPIYDSGQSVGSALNVGSVVLIQPAPQDNTTVELNTGTRITVMLPYEQVMKKINK